MVRAAAAVKGKLNNSLPSSQHNTKHPKPKIKTTAVGAPSLHIFAEPTGNAKVNNNSEPDRESKKLAVIEGRCSGFASASTSALNGMGKKNCKLDNSGKSNVRRKVLADISNVRTSFSRTKVQDRSKSLYSSRNSLVDTQAGSCSSGKPFSGIVRSGLTQATVNRRALKNGGYKDTKTTSDDLGTKTKNGKLVKTTNSRTYGGNRPPLTRKSFPAVKQVNKESTERSQMCKDKCGFPVSSNVGRTVAWKTRVSDGCIVMALNGRSNMDVGTSRRSTRLMQTMKLTSSKVERTSNSKSISGFKKPLPTKNVSSKKNDEKAELSSTNNIGKEEVSPFSKSNLESAAADNVITRKSARRKSFTSLLVSRSKEDLPSIYDPRNHLEVSEYIDDIYQYYWVMEGQNQPLKLYMETQTEITHHMRGVLINWLIEVHLKFDLMQETLFLMVTLLDQFLSLVSIKKNKMQLVGLTALLLASKYEDFWHPRIMDLISISADSYTRDEMLGMENAFLKTLKFRLNAPTPYVFMLRFLKAARSDKTFEHLAFYLIELCLVEYEALKYKPSLLCASAIYLARCTMQITPTWTPLLQKHTRYEEYQIRQCAEMILKFHKAAKTTLLRVTYDKYMKPELSRVAAINPLEMLPQ